MSRDRQQLLGCLFTVQGGMHEGKQWQSPVLLGSSAPGGQRPPWTSSSSSVPQAWAQRVVQSLAWRPVLHSPFCLLRALCLFIQETLAGKAHELHRTGCWAQLKPQGSLLPQVPLTLACPWPSGSAKLTVSCQTSLHVVETPPLCLFTNR